ncbi:MAG: DNA translocase FtsK [Clostridiales bacterium]|nr:DNA translocase FtsK [Clostridiales bacterium]MCF8023658.1 DNA translocase FtsK [Clostridiales bacterium]
MAQSVNKKIKYELLGLGLIAVSILTAASYITPAVGKIGQIIFAASNIVAGNGKLLLPVFIGYLGIHLMIYGRIKPTRRVVGIITIFMTILIYLHLRLAPGQVISTVKEGTGGGILGALPAYVLLPSFGKIGTYIILTTFFIVGIIFFTGTSIVTIISIVTVKLFNTLVYFLKLILKKIISKIKNIKKKQAEIKKNKKSLLLEETANSTAGKNANKVSLHNYSIQQVKQDKTKQENKKTAEQAENKEHVPSHVNKNHFQLPPKKLLKPGEQVKLDESAIRERSNHLEQILSSFGIKAEVTNVAVGPAITRYEIKPPPGIKVSRISGLADDIALGMAASRVRIEAPIPQKAAVGIEVPNPEINPVNLRELLESNKFTGSKSKLTVALGKSIDGTPVAADLNKMPHLLIAGATGAGKSVCVNTLICSILFNASPEEVKFILIDPKMVELANYNGIPHLISPVVTEPKKAAGALYWVVKEMERRYELFASTGVREISRYNQLCQERELSTAKQDKKDNKLEENAAKKQSTYNQGSADTNDSIEQKDKEENDSAPLPYIVVIIDELSDLMMIAPGEVEDAICRLAQMARACGIHLVIATQRPSVDVITGLIKANVPSRISFAVSSQTDSRTILDTGGAEKLLGKGDMLYYPVGAPKPVRVQGAFVSDNEVESMVEYLAKQAEPVYNEDVTSELPQEREKEKDEDWDDLLPRAAQTFIESGTASISMLQRRLHIGYARAARIVDIMERRGIVGSYEGSKPRQVLMTWDQYNRVFGEQQAQAN